MALGASNLTRGLQTVVATARAEWGPGVEVVAALGHGRSYGAPSWFLGRSLPGILHSGLWEALAALPPATTRALVTDVGNDILYGFSSAQILEWVGQAVDRLQRYTPEIVLTDLPLFSIRGLSNPKFLFFRSVFYPPCRLSLAEVVGTAGRVNDGLAVMASQRGLRFVRMRPEWYGVDPIHIRPSLWRASWQHILGCEHCADVNLSWVEGVRLHCMRPEQQWLFGVEQHSPQSGTPLSRGGTVWLY